MEARGQMSTFKCRGLRVEEIGVVPECSSGRDIAFALCHNNIEAVGRTEVEKAQ